MTRYCKQCGGMHGSPVKCPWCGSGEQSREPTRFCCADMKTAQKLYTDSEGYGALATWHERGLYIGCGLPPLEICPWCGSKLQTMPVCGSATPPWRTYD